MSGRSNPGAQEKPSPQRSVASTERASYHIRARVAQATANAEDYVSAISALIGSRGEARVTEVARSLGVTHVTVVRTIARLKRAGLVSAQPYQPIALTLAGADLAERVVRRHRVVIAFLAALGVSPETARTDAEGIEHHVSAETLAAMERFVAR